MPRKRATSPEAPAPPPAAPAKKVAKPKRPDNRPPEKRPRAGTYTMTPEKEAAIIRTIALGAPLKVAAAAAGVPSDTLATWIRRFPDFAERMEGAKAKQAVAALQRINTIANEGSFPAARWQLEHLYPEHYRPKAGIQIPIAAPGDADADPDSTVPPAGGSGIALHISLPYIPGRLVRDDPDALDSIDAVLLAQAAERRAATANQRKDDRPK